MKLAFFAFIFCAACQQAPKPTNAPLADKIKTRSDSLYTQVMDLHNETMAKYGKLLGYEKKAMQKADSLKTVASKCYCEGLHEQKALFDSLASHLKMAENNMNDWMAQFDAEPKTATTEAQKTVYFQDQKEKAQKMRDGFFAALSKAEKMFGKP